MGENVTTRDMDLLSLPTGTLLKLGETAVVEVTGLRSPCSQLNTLQPGLMNACFTVDGGGRQAPRAGIMGIVLTSGELRPGDRIQVTLPPLPHWPLKCV
jgi:MOSC domain-containing protein YiiM